VEVKDLTADSAKTFRPTRRTVVALRKPAEMAWSEFAGLKDRIVRACVDAGDWWDVATLFQPKVSYEGHLPPGAYVIVSEIPDLTEVTTDA